MDMEIIHGAVNTVLENVALGVISLLGAMAVYYINLAASKVKAQTSQIQDEESRKLLENALEDVTDLATVSVGAMEQTTAKALREAVKGGKADREQPLARGNDGSLLVRQLVNAMMADNLIVTPNIDKYLQYLEDGGYIRYTDRKVNAYNAYRRDAVVQLTKKGIDLIEDTIQDGGINV